MAARNYHLTPLARQQLRHIKAYSLTKWGQARTDKYFHDLHEGLQYAALNQEYLPTNAPTRLGMAGDTGLILHHIGSHYVAFKRIADDEIIVGAVLGENMDIPNRLRELEAMAAHEIAAIKDLIAREAEE